MFIHGDQKKNETNIEIEFLPCYNDHPDCPPDWKAEVIDSDLELNLISRRYDISNPNSPLKYHYESILVPVSEDGVLHTFINVVRNDYRINEWYSFFKEGETKTFYSFEKGESYFMKADHSKPFLPSPLRL